MKTQQHQHDWFYWVLFLLVQITIFQNCLSQENSTKNNDSDLIPSDTTHKWYRYIPNIYTLKGLLIAIQTYGPPNYGEDTATDQKVTYFALKLDSPINVLGEENDDYVNTETEEGIETIQLRFAGREPTKYLNQILNKEVSIRGQLFHSMRGPDYTRILIYVLYINLLDNEL